MKYMKADSVLPVDLVEELQTYIQGGYLYVPAKKERRKKWGELSGYRTEIEKRNRKIRSDYHRGMSMEDLAGKYCLSVYSIRKIVYTHPNIR